MKLTELFWRYFKKKLDTLKVLSYARTLYRKVTTKIQNN